MKKYERLLIWGFFFASLAIIAYFSTKVFQWSEPGQEQAAPLGAPVARQIKIDLNSPADLQSWNRHSFHGETQYEIHDEPDGAKSLKAASLKSCSALFKPLSLSLSEEPVISWQWKVAKFPSGKKNEVFGAKSESDFAARVSVIFRSELPLQQDIVQYVWDDHFPAGTHGTSPFWKKVKILVLHTGPPEKPGDWVSEKRNIVEDYRLLFGKSPEKDIEAIGVMSDSDDTKSETEAYFRNFQIETLHSEEPEIKVRKNVFPIPLAPLFKKTGNLFGKVLKIPAKIPAKKVLSTTKRVVTWPIRKVESR